MARERYPGEQRGLTLFLADLLPAVQDECGTDSLLFHAIRRGLRSGDLDHLRHARKLFNHLPRDVRRALSATIVVRSRRTTQTVPREHDEACAARTPVPSASFEPSAKDAEAVVQFTHEPLPPHRVRVTVTPGLLPHTAAESLRRIADMIEQDRRLLSKRYWQDRAGKAADHDQYDRR